MSHFSCRGTEGLIKDAVMTGVSIVDGENKVYLNGQNVIRAAGGFAATRILEGKQTLDGTVWKESRGKSQTVYASGTLAEMNGKTYNWTAEPAGYGRFTVTVDYGAASN